MPNACAIAALENVPTTRPMEEMTFASQLRLAAAL
jgi:hypothetical protein